MHDITGPDYVQMMKYFLEGQLSLFCLGPPLPPATDLLRLLPSISIPGLSFWISSFVDFLMLTPSITIPNLSVLDLVFALTPPLSTTLTAAWVCASHAPPPRSPA